MTSPTRRHLSLFYGQNPEHSWYRKAGVGVSSLVKLNRFRWWLLVICNVVFLIAGQTSATLLGRFYYDKGGSSTFMATLVQSAAFPILIPLLLLPSSRSPPQEPPNKHHVCAVYVVLGILIAGDNLLYSVGLLYLSASTYSLICTTQLVFNVLFSYFLNGQRLTALILNSVVTVTLSAALLAVNGDSDAPPGVTKVHYTVGFLSTLGASALYSLVLSLMQLSFQKVIKKTTSGCLGALDGTFISVHVSNVDRSKYRTRKGALAMNVLGVCNPNMEFIYILPGWEGSAHDGRVLRDAISRPNGLKVPKGCYYLVDAGYTNCEGFLAPYRGHNYHLKEWGDTVPDNPEEYFNMKHAKARNVIERCFGLLKGRWAILRSTSFFPIRTQGRIVSVCALLHNLIRKYMPTDVGLDLNIEEEEEEDEEEEGELEDQEWEENEPTEYITQVSTSDAWDDFRKLMAHTLYNNWSSSSS